MTLPPEPQQSVPPPRPRREWYYAGPAGRAGPVQQEEFEAKIESGEVKPDTLVWTAPMGSWSRADYIVELQPLLATKVALAPPTVPGPMYIPPTQAVDAGTAMLLPLGRAPWAIAAGYLGLVSILGLPAPFAILTGVLALRAIKRNPELRGRGRAWFGIIMGTLGTAFFAFTLVMRGLR